VSVGGGCGIFSPAHALTVLSAPVERQGMGSDPNERVPQHLHRVLLAHVRYVVRERRFDQLRTVHRCEPSLWYFSVTRYSVITKDISGSR